MKKKSFWETKRSIGALTKLSASNAHPSRYLPILKSVLSGVRFPAITIKNDVLYRSRWNERPELFSSLADLRYPDKSLVVRKGRLNDVGESVLYAAACELGTIIEARPNIDKLFTISTIKPRNADTLFFPLGITDKGYFSDKEASTERLVIDYICSEITKITECVDDYNSTIALAHHFLKTKISGRDSKACIAYPSIESRKISNKTTYNVAMLPETFDANFYITGATVFCLTNEESHYQLNPLNTTTSISEAGKLDWQFSFQEMLDRASRGITADGTHCENVKHLYEVRA